MKPWDQQKDESAQAFASFTKYRDAGVTRTLNGVYSERLGGVPKRASGRWQDWAKRYRWHARAAAWDNEQQQIRDEAQNRAIAKVAEKAAVKQEISAQRILQEQANIAFSRPHRIMPWKGVPGLVDSDQLSDQDLAAIKSMKITTDEDGNRTVHLQFWDKSNALDKLGQSQKLWNTRDDGGQPQQNFVAFFLDICKSGELQREAERRGILPKTEVIEAQKG
jgi:terminase small subunit-like protein